MRLAKYALCLFTLLVSATAAQPAQKTDLTGSWVFMWDADAGNVNDAALKQKGSSITGTYTNDAKDACKVEGSVKSAKKVELTITCPNWDIKCDGTIKDAKSVAGKYTAYGDSKGEFKMTRMAPR